MLELLLPSACAICSRFLTFHETGVCRECTAALPGMEVPPGPHGMQRWAGGPYEAGLAEAVQRLKFSGERWRGRALGLTATNLAGYDRVVPVPLHPSRLRERGYNQCDFVARGVAQRIGARLDRHLLRRTHFDGPQAELGATERGAIAEAFESRPCPDQRILVVDDVTTTGHTLEACRAALKRGGALVVDGYAVAFTEPSGALDALEPA